MNHAWTEALLRAAISESDRRAARASETARAFVLDRLATEDHDALHGWSSLGRVLAAEGASPSLAASAVDALVEARKDARPPPWAVAARATLVEAYVAAERERSEERIAEAWAFPR